MLRDVKLELLLNGIRWTSNILVELLANNGDIDDTGREHLRAAVKSLGEADLAYRRRPTKES